MNLNHTFPRLTLVVIFILSIVGCQAGATANVTPEPASMTTISPPAASQVTPSYEASPTISQESGTPIIQGPSPTIDQELSSTMTPESTMITNQLPAVDEAQVRYILADIQLGGSVENYRQFIAKPVVAEALRRWDARIRVINLSRFERMILGDQSWQVVYLGSEIKIDGMDVLLSTDPFPTSVPPDPR